MRSTSRTRDGLLLAVAALLTLTADGEWLVRISDGAVLSPSWMALGWQPAVRH